MKKFFKNPIKPFFMVGRRKFFKNIKEVKSVSETSKCRDSLAPFCNGDGVDIGYGGDPIVPNAICMDLPDSYAKYKVHIQSNICMEMRETYLGLKITVWIGCTVHTFLKILLIQKLCSMNGLE